MFECQDAYGETEALKGGKKTNHTSSGTNKRSPGERKQELVWLGLSWEKRRESTPWSEGILGVYTKKPLKVSYLDL